MRETRRASTSTALRTPLFVAVTVLLVAVIITAPTGPASAAPTVFVHPAEVTVEPGDTFSMSIRIDAGTDTVTCFLTEFTFDADVIELTEASEGSLFSMCGYGTMYHWDEIESGRHSCNDVTLGHEAHVLPPGELVDLEFTAGDQGATWIEITTVDLRDMQRNPILPVNAERALVTIGGTGVEDPQHVDGCALLSVHPNPCRGTATLSWSAPVGERRGTLLIYDARGRLVWHDLLDGASGVVRWDGRGRGGEVVRTGAYFVELRFESKTVREKLILLR